MKWHFVQGCTGFLVFGGLQNLALWKYSTPLQPPHFEKYGYALVPIAKRNEQANNKLYTLWQFSIIVLKYHGKIPPSSKDNSREQNKLFTKWMTFFNKTLSKQIESKRGNNKKKIKKKNTHTHTHILRPVIVYRVKICWENISRR